MEEAASAERESNRTKLIVGGESGSSSGNYDISLEMKEGFPPQALAFIKMLESKIEVSDSKIGVLTSKVESLTKENKELKEEKLKEKLKGKVRVPSVAKNDRNEIHLNGPLAYKMITAFELWREIALFL